MHEFSRWVGQLKQLEQPSELLIFKNIPLLDPKDETRDQILAIVMRTIIGRTEKETIYKYAVLSDDWDWGYEPSRLQAKALILIAQRNQIHAYGYDIRQADLSGLLSGQIFPGALYQHQSTCTWHPEDYIDLPEKSVCAKETQEVFRIHDNVDQLLNVTPVH